MLKTSESAEDYLERIYELIEDKGYARVGRIEELVRFLRKNPNVLRKIKTGHQERER